MAAVDVVYTKRGCRVDVDGLAVEVESPHLDRGAIRATLSIRDDEGLRYHSTVNLTSERARGHVTRKLAADGITLDEGILIALDVACRRRSPGAAEKQRCDGGTDVSETVPLDLAGLHAAFARWLLIKDRSFLVVVVGAVLAHLLTGDPVWLLIVAPPGGTKSEILRALYGCRGIFPLSELTARTFASGLDAPGGDPSLLARLHDEILVLKDFTTVLEMHREERQAILAQLREIYDGRFDKVWGTGRELHWEGRVGFLAGVTPIIDRHQAALSVLGERFILYRPVMADRKKLATSALRSVGRETQMRKELAAAMHGFLKARKGGPPKAGPTVLATLATVADFITRARSGVVRDGYRRELEYAPEPEAPTRFAKVLLSLASGIALAHDSDRITRRELRIVLRVALDCLPLIRQRVIAALVRGAITETGGGTLSTSAISGAAQFSTATIRRALEDLQALGLVVGHKPGEGKADRWELGGRWVDVFRTLTDASARRDGGSDRSGKVGPTVPETSEGASHTTNGQARSASTDAGAGAGADQEVLEWTA
jgi:hypothetical protein